ncbi:MAG TPA: hypothetical protein VFL70_03915 [Bacteroidia bacterium]|jgi:hypothetical protein|nr:hypothetical protein [Bacteroidia bacterium]
MHIFTCMKDRKNIYKNYFTRHETGDEITINELRDKESRNENLSEEESQALLNFEKFRLTELNKTTTDFDFNARYCQLEILANVAAYKEFLKEEYYFSELL